MRRAYLAVGRLISPIFILGLRFYTLLTGVERVRILVVNEKGNILLIRGVISDGTWSLPGGGINRGEPAVAAARRELLEETGIDATEQDFKYLMTLEKAESGASFKSPLFLLRVKHSALPERPSNKWEIANIGWFKRSDLPPSLSSLTRVVLSKYKARS